ncbi:MAG: OmpW/AlkL family protein [Chakrabartia sp.]
MSTQKGKILLAALLASAVATPAMAAAGDTYVRVRGIMIAPNEKSGGILPGLPDEKVKVDNAVVPEVDVTQMVTDNIGFELIAATSKHSVSGVSGTTGSIGKLASTWVLPPTLTAQYHFAPEAKLRPYVGAGVNYTLFYSEKASSGFEAAAGPTDVHLKSSFGWAAQAGVDIDLSKRMFLNLDIKYIDIRTKARLVTEDLGTQTVKVNLNPIVVGVGVGFRL